MKLEDVIILPQHVTVKWNNSNTNHFVNKAYKYTKKSDEFEVNVLDLPLGSRNFVNCKCGNCGAVIQLVYKRAVDYVNNQRNPLCSNCKDLSNVEFFNKNLEKLKEIIILPQKVKLNWNSSNTNRYKAKGYIYTKQFDEFEVDVLDLTIGSKVAVKCRCKFCKKEIMKSFKSICEDLDLLCCKKCAPLKQKQLCIEKYGVENSFQIAEVKEKIKEKSIQRYKKHSSSKTAAKSKTMKVNPYQLPEVRERIKQTNLKKYGVEHYTQSEEFKQKSKKTNLERYGVEFASQSNIVREKVKNTVLEKYGYEHISQVPEIKEKQSKSWAKTIYKNGSGPSSTQQRHIQSLVSGELNYPVDKSLLDIAFTEDKLYIEYNGGGHDLNVKLGQISPEQFKFNEIKRTQYLKEKGWKLIRIISKKDYLPQDDEIVKLIEECKCYLNTNHSWIEIDIDKRLIKCSQFEKEIYINLRKL